jgi:hypothetical protein
MGCAKVGCAHAREVAVPLVIGEKDDIVRRHRRHPFFLICEGRKMRKISTDFTDLKDLQKFERKSSEILKIRVIHV